MVNAKQHILRGDGVGNLHAEEHVEAQGKVAAEVLAYGIEIDGGGCPRGVFVHGQKETVGVSAAVRCRRDAL